MYEQNWTDDHYWLNLTCYGPEEIELVDKDLNGGNYHPAWFECCKGYALTGDYLITGYENFKLEHPESEKYKIHKFDSYFGFDCYFLQNDGPQQLAWELEKASMCKNLNLLPHGCEVHGDGKTICRVEPGDKSVSVIIEEGFCHTFHFR